MCERIRNTKEQLTSAVETAGDPSVQEAPHHRERDTPTLEPNQLVQQHSSGGNNWWALAQVGSGKTMVKLR